MSLWDWLFPKNKSTYSSGGGTGGGGGGGWGGLPTLPGGSKILSEAKEIGKQIGEQLGKQSGEQITAPKTTTTTTYTPTVERRETEIASRSIDPYERARQEAETMARSLGIDPRAVDPGYVSALVSGDVDKYMQEKAGGQTATTEARQFTGPAYIPGYTSSGGSSSSGTRYTPQAPDFRPQIQKWGQETLNTLLAKIEQAKQQGLAGLQGVDQLIRQQTQAGLSASDVEKAKMLQQIYEAAEASGAYRGGESVAGQIAANTMAGNIAGQLRQIEAQQLAEIQRAIQQIEQQAEQEKIAAQSDVSAKELQALMDAERYGADYALKAAGQDLAERQFDFTKDIERQKADLERQKFIASKEWQDFQKQLALDDVEWSRSENNPAVRGQLIANEIARLKLLNLPKELELEIQKLEQDLLQGRASINEIYTRIRNAAAGVKQEQLSAYKGMIDQMYGEKNPVTGAVAYNTEAVKNYIRNLNLSGQITDEEAKQLLSLYGFSY